MEVEKSKYIEAITTIMEPYNRIEWIFWCLYKKCKEGYGTGEATEGSENAFVGIPICE